MILELLLNLITGIVKLLFSFVNLPAFPEEAQVAIDTYMGYIFNNLDFLSFFVNVNTLKIVASVAIGLFIFDRSYKILIWIIRKIPLSIE